MSSKAALYQILYQDDVLFSIPNTPQKFADKTDLELEVAKTDNPAVSVTPLNNALENKNVSVKFQTLIHPILILIDEPKQPSLIETEAILLNNILKAVDHSIDQADIINLSFLKNRDATTALLQKKTNYFITFGVPLIKLNLDLLLTPYSTKEMGGVKFLMADTLSNIDASRDIKKKLWVSLKLMFQK